MPKRTVGRPPSVGGYPSRPMKRARLEELAPTMWPAMRMQSMPMQSMPVAYPMMISPPMMMQQPFIHAPATMTGLMGGRALVHSHLYQRR